MYKILNTKTEGELIETEVEFTLGKETVVCSIPHFTPKNMEEVISNIENRELSERIKKEQEVINEQIIEELMPVMLINCISKNDRDINVDVGKIISEDIIK